MPEITKSELIRLQKKLKTDQVIGDKFGVTRQAIHQLRQRLGVDSRYVEHAARNEKIKALYSVADELGQKFGKHTLHLGCSHLIDKLGKGRRGTATVREQTQLKGETRRRHLGLPLIHVKTQP